LRHLSKEHKLKLSKSLKGRKTWNEGLTKYSDDRMKIISKNVSKTLTGRKLSKLHKENISKGGRGLKRPSVTDQWRKKQSLSHIGNKPSEKTKEKMSKSAIIRISNRSGNKFYNTKPERFLQSILSVNGVKYTTQKSIYGIPDIFIEPNICIFVDGCFYHGCKKCHNKKTLSGIIPTKQMKRDILVNNKLELLNYRVIRVWEHDILNNLNNIYGLIKGELKFV